MVQSPSLEANWFAASQEIPRISRNPKVHHHTHKRPPPVSILGQPNPVHIPTSHLLEIHPNIIHPSMPRSPPVVSFPPVSPPKPYTSPSPHPYVPHAQPISFFSKLSVLKINTNKSNKNNTKIKQIPTNNHATNTEENFLILRYLMITIKQQRNCMMTANTN